MIGRQMGVLFDGLLGQHHQESRFLDFGEPNRTIGYERLGFAKAPAGFGPVGLALGRIAARLDGCSAKITVAKMMP
jgi:hypothetical protein